MQNLNEHKEEIPTWLERLLEEDQELFVPFSAWDDMEQRLNVAFGAQEKIDMEKLFPLPSQAAVQMEHQLDIHYAAQFDSNIAEKIHQENISLPLSAWDQMNDMLNQHSTEPIEHIPVWEHAEEIPLPNHAWALMEAALEEQLGVAMEDEVLNMPYEPQWNQFEEIALPQMAWAAMEDKLNEHYHESFEDEVRAKLLPNSELVLPQSAWASMSETLDAYYENKERKKRILAYSLLALLFGSVLVGGAYYFLQGKAYRDTDDTYQDAKHIAIAQHKHSSSHQDSQSNSFGHNISSPSKSSPTEKGTSTYSSQHKSSTPAPQAKVNSKPHRPSNANINAVNAKANTTDITEESKHKAAEIWAENMATIAVPENDYIQIDNIFEKGDMAEGFSSAPHQPLNPLKENSDATMLQTQDNAKANEILNPEHVIDNLLAELSPEDLDLLKNISLIDSFSLDNNNPKALEIEQTTTKAWQYFVQLGLSNQVLLASEKISSAANIGFGLKYNITTKSSLTFALQARQLYPSGGFFGINGNLVNKIDDYQVNRRDEFMDAISRQDIFNLKTDDIYQIKQITILELPITYTRKISKRFVVETGIRVGAHISASAKRQEDIDLETKAMQISRYDMGLKFLNFGALLGAEFKISSKFSLLVRYSNNFTNMFAAAQATNRLYDTRGMHKPTQGHEFMLLSNESLQSPAILLQTPKRLIDNDILFALRYTF